MAVTHQFEVEGMEALFKKMDDLRDEIGKGKTDKIWRQVMTYAMEPVLQDCVSTAPYDPNSKDGHMRDHIYMAVHKPKSRDKGSASYQGELYMARVTVSPIRDSTTWHTRINKRGNFQTTTRGKKPVAVSMEFGNAHVAAQPFIRQSLSTNIDNVTSRLGEAIMAQINRLAEKKV
ncbi:hypothetical protein UFOVP263_48 [uncultured Caudovirales phage]|uniref:Phge_HK97_gp10, phage protein, HK97 gp10 family n=1 Tax=uncultured Caudovirales phage TaxID=2100421 RepID=A0A6J5TBG0_9CAUD|nr:hypothetical protein UFOVP263_48 [uncultured Caudovirales phage]CAB4242009.1 hypothetical protein UFOVP91_14 [uncultured Caudovirales phage]